MRALLIIYILTCSGAIGARLSGDASSVRSLVGDYMGLITQNISTTTTGVVIAMVANWKIAIVILIIIPLMGVQGYLQVKFLEGFSKDAKVINIHLYFNEMLPM